ncbi:subtilase family protein [Striga asiatica]|uniref:Subtilase family protein n=1 Tax=Striga asiatica TaxID=4170 RepID=A0A5A7PB72_STRAF|nr:subtilase family protein [Striga asiatica]
MGHILGLVVLFLSLSSALFVHADDDEDVSTYIVSVNNIMKPAELAEVQHWYESTLESLEDSNYNNNPYSKSSKYSSKILHVYNTVFHGFSAKLTPRQAQQLKERPWVVSVLPDRVYNLHTTRSPYFLGLYLDYNFTIGSPVTNESDYGSNVIIGFLDIGIDPEHPSFNDEGLGRLPTQKKWKGGCENGIECNNKLIGARIYTDGTDFGHGTHTASTAAGRAVENVAYAKNGNSTAVGVAAKARIASYQVCNVSGCTVSHVLAGLDKAVEDGVDIISMSIGSDTSDPYEEDPIAIGAFGAMYRGVSVITSAGNSGPSERTVTNVAPWVTTVAAGTMDRGFTAYLATTQQGTFHGASLYGGEPTKPLPLAYGRNCMMLDNSFSGKIVFCDTWGDIDVAELVENVANAGGAGVVAAYMYPNGRELIAQDFKIPGLSITEFDGNELRHHLINGTITNATMIFRGMEIVTDQLPAPAVAFFSSRGPNNISPYVMKPDVLAPGVNILAAWPEGVDQFKLQSGTSMACPHVSGLAALLKAIHPKWSPAMIRSAIMTTAYNTANDGKPILNNDDLTLSTTLDMGAGHIDTDKARDPGLVYDITPQDYVDFLCASKYTNATIQTITNGKYGETNCTGNTMPWDLNYPAISVDSQSLLDGDITVKRTVTNVGEDYSSYTVTVTNPKGVSLTVNPVKMDFNSKGDKQSYNVTVTSNVKQLPAHDISVEGKIVWSDEKRRVVSPVVIVITGN